MKQIISNRNENPYGPSPKCMRTLSIFRREHASSYADGYGNSILANKLSNVFKISADRIIVSYGAEGFLQTVFDSLSPKKDSVLIHEFQYSYIPKYLKSRNIKVRYFKMPRTQSSFSFNIDDCIRLYKHFRPTVLIINSPVNPTGNSISLNEMERILKMASSNTLIILDEAYHGFANSYDQKGFRKLIDKYPNLAIVRTLSKWYALAGLRIGFTLCGAKVRKMIHYGTPYLGLSRILEQVAISAIESNAYYKRTSRRIMRDRDWLIKQIRTLKNFNAYDSDANFIIANASLKAKKLLESKMHKEKVLIAKFVKDSLMRITIGSTKNVRNFFKLLSAIDNKLK